MICLRRLASESHCRTSMCRCSTAHGSPRRATTNLWLVVELTAQTAAMEGKGYREDQKITQANAIDIDWRARTREQIIVNRLESGGVNANPKKNNNWMAIERARIFSPCIFFFSITNQLFRWTTLMTNKIRTSRVHTEELCTIRYHTYRLIDASGTII